MKLKKMFFLMLATVLTFAACGDKEEELDGNWPPMKWKTEVKMDKNHNIQVPVKGGEYMFECRNYKPWISSVDECVLGHTTSCYPHEHHQWNHMTTQWGEVEICDNVVKVRINANDSFVRTYRIILTAGDIFDTFCFNQATELYTE